MNDHSGKAIVIGSNGLVGGGGNSFIQEPISHKLKCMGFNISHCSKTAQFLIVSTGVMVFFIMYGYLIVSFISF